MEVPKCRNCQGISEIRRCILCVDKFCVYCLTDVCVDGPICLTCSTEDLLQKLNILCEEPSSSNEALEYSSQNESSTTSEDVSENEIDDTYFSDEYSIIEFYPYDSSESWEENEESESSSGTSNTSDNSSFDEENITDITDESFQESYNEDSVKNSPESD